jgi:hypothetical protein
MATAVEASYVAFRRGWGREVSPPHHHQNSACGYCELFPWSLKLNTYPHQQKRKIACSFDFVVLCALILILLTWRIWWAPNNSSRWQMGFNAEFKVLITILEHWWLWSYFKITGMCSGLSSLCQGLKRRAVRWCEILKISLCCILFVHSWVQGKGTHHHDMDQMWCLRGASDTLQKVNFRNKFSFRCIYIHCKWLSQETKVQISPR